MARLLNAFQSHLIAAGVVRDPETAGPLPPMWLEPKLGIPAPGEGQGVQVGPDAVLAALRTGGIAPDPMGGFLRFPFVEVQMRPRIGYLAEDIELQMTGSLIDRTNFVMGTGPNAMNVVRFFQVAALGRLGSDAQGFRHTTTYGFDLARPNYTGPS